MPTASKSPINCDIHAKYGRILKDPNHVIGRYPPDSTKSPNSQTSAQTSGRPPSTFAKKVAMMMGLLAVMELVVSIT